ncbi:2-oxoglutarate dehydrogenase, E2 component, dihydrolipoamide succinyltransferase [Rhodococcus sp. X156]|uniref:2-oxoglutarate dehydrogenase, E2 component, dihydrolipoamide succinyltransferase n=1 Tax=Rhodococcus sp. X156 TaxID=2499145 RepID=UPI000FD9D7CB|nr:2-oxoglutarate dehydrogenase, E2 component, dihydrolipoamide succinyltransferase [Rhodococcus sp. X156]
MAFSVQMPALGESVTEGTVTRWLKQEGDTVAVDEPLLEVSTDKVDTEIPSPAAGVLQRIVAAEDETVEIGAELAVIAEEGESTDDGGDSADDTAEQDSTEDEDSAPEPEAEESGAEESSTEESGAEESSQDQDEAEQAPAGGAKPNKGGSGTDVTMPELGESVTEGIITRWLKQVGDEVAVDEPLVEISTDKVDTEIPSPVAGVLLEQTAAEDDTVEVGGVLGKIGSADDASAGADDTDDSEPEQETAEGEATQDETAQRAETDDAAEEAAEEQEAAEPAKAESKPAEAKPADSKPADSKPDASTSAGDKGSAPYVTPLVRKLANQKGVDLDSLTGTGVGGRIRKQDVLAAAEAKDADSQQAAPAEEAASTSDTGRSPAATAGVRPELAALRGTKQKANRIRQITATKTRESLQTTAQLTQTFEVDMSRVAALRTRAKASFQKSEGVNLTFLPFFAKAVVEALKAHPNVNASYNEDAKEITYHGAVHLAIAVDTPNGLLSPVIHNAGDLSLAGLARAIADLADRTRNNKLKPDELSGGTFTITNIGSQGALFDTPILVPPQAGMLGTGAIVKRPVVVTDELGNDSLAIRSMCFLPLTYDHRLIDGADAGRFLTTVKQRLEDAAFEADLGL